MADEYKIQPYKPAMLDRMRKLSAMVGSSGSGGPEDEIDLRYVLRVLRDRYRTIVAVTIALTLAALVVSLLMEPVYRSQAIIEIKQATPTIESLQQLQSRNTTPDDVVATEIETEIGILKSDTLARKVIDQLHLADKQEPSFSLSSLFDHGWEAISRWWTGSDDDSLPKPTKSSPAQANGAATQMASSVSSDPEMDAKSYEKLVSGFESGLTVKRVGGSRLVNVSYQSGDPNFAARVVNSVVSTYLQLHEKSTERLTRALAVQVQEAKKELERSERAMTGYARQNGLLYLQSDNGTSQNIVDQRLKEIQGELTKAQADRYQKESVYRLIQKGDYGSLPGVFQDTLLQNLTVQVANLKRQYAQLSTTFTDNYPKVQQVKSQLTAMEKALARERARAAANVTNDYLAAVRREALLVRAYEQQKNAATTVAEKSSQYNILKRNTETDNKLYESLLQNVKEASLIAQIKANNVNVVDKAVPQFFPVKPRILLNLALGLIAGLGLGIGLAFLQEYLDTTLKTVDEVDRFLGVPALAMIPSVDSLPGKVANGNNHSGSGMLLPDLTNTSALTKSEEPWHRIDKQAQTGYLPLVEAFRTLGSSVMLEASGGNRMLRSIVITSSQPGEGKTTVSVNLAIELAQQGRRVILIDADLRRPSVHRALGFRNIRGLSGYLGGASEWAPLVLPGLTPGLDTLPAGPPPKNPVAMLASSRMKILIGQVLEEYDYVIVDSPALMINLVDARILSGLVDGSILVIRSGMAPREFVIRARKHLRNVMGVVLNNMDVRSMENYYGYHSYGYGNGNSNDEEFRDNAFEKRRAGL
ncbi:MAG: polysaccharide biosynthesis tyrosine autokinase [Acidobacteriota bacterium]